MNLRTTYEYTETVVYGTLQKNLRPDTIYVLTDEISGEPYAVAFLCPCGCGQEVYVLADKTVKNSQTWACTLADGKVTLAPSLQQTGGCKSHFFIEANNVRWV